MTRLSFRKIEYIALMIICSAMLVACKKHKDETQDPPIVRDGGVYIINEGNYQWSNGTVDYYRFADGSLTDDIFESVNQRPLGDVVQSMIIDDGRGYIIVNNSGKVEAVSLIDFASVGTITGLTSPRYLIPVGGGKAYVSDLYSNSLSIVDLSTFQKTGQIPLHGSTEEMVLSGQTVFVTNTRTSFIYLVDIVTHTLVDSIAVGYASNSIRMDKDGKLWVLCAGDKAQSVNARFYRIDAVTKQVIISFDLGNSIDIWDKMTMNGAEDIIYFLNNGVWKLEITASSLASGPLISKGSSQFYGIGVDPVSGNIYVSDAIDYVQKGKVFRFKPDGTLINSFSTGIIPSGFCFH
jgi:YVTN family beta-propeller protein